MRDDPRVTEGFWREHRADQVRRTASATPLQRLRWLEEAIAFAARAGAIRRDPSRQAGGGFRADLRLPGPLI
jgi:hypothetical protein